MIGLLNQELADTSDLYSQTKQAHWNVKGIHFYQLHLLFDELAEKRQGEADELAERSNRARRVRVGHRSYGCGELPPAGDPDRHQRRCRLHAGARRAVRHPCQRHAGRDR